MSACLPGGMLTIVRNRRARMFRGTAGLSMGVARLQGDPIGTCTLNFINLAQDSRVLVQTLDGNTIRDEFVATASAEQRRTIPLYISGSPLNNIRIRVRKASSFPVYRPFETQQIAQKGEVSVFIFQEPDE